jgi:hypothetical protein
VDIVMQMANVQPFTSPVFCVEQLVTILDAAPILSRVGSRIYLKVQQRQSRLVLVWDLLRKLQKCRLNSMEGERSVEEYIFHELRHEQQSSLEENEWNETLNLYGVNVKFI